MDINTAIGNFQTTLTQATTAVQQQATQALATLQNQAGEAVSDTVSAAVKVAVAQALANAAAKATGPTKWLGTNDNGNSYYDTVRWTDMSKSFSGWYPGGGNPFTYSKNNYPIGAAGINAMCQCWMVDVPVGVLNVTWSGNATLKIGIYGGANFVQTGPNSGTLQVDQVCKLTNGNPSLVVVVTCTFSDPNNPLDNLHFWLPGYGPNTPKAGNVLRDEHVNLFKPYSSVRFMNTLNAASNTEINWSDRVLPTAWDKTGRGVSHEEVIAYINQLYKQNGLKRAWVNVPIGASDDYVTQMAKLYRDNLPADLELIVELSNEIWNWGGGFNGFGYVNALANGVPDAMFPNIVPNVLAFDGNIVNGKFQQTPQNGAAVTDSYTRAARGAAHMAAHVARLWQGVWADRLDKLSPVICGCSANQYWLSLGLQFLVARDGTHPFRYLGIAPYFDCYANNGQYLKPSGPNGTVTLDDIFASATAYIWDTVYPGIQAQLAQHLAIAKTYGLQVVTYEGGQSFYPQLTNGNYTGTDVVTQSESDPRMGLLYDDYHAVLHVGGVYMHHDFVALSSWSKWGFWGDSQSYEDITVGNYRYHAVVREGYRSNLN